MTVSEVLAAIEALQDARGIVHWNKLGSPLRGYGVGLTKLRKLAKEVGRDPALAAQLDQTDVYEARVIGLLIDDPKRLTRAQVEAQVDRPGFGQLTHVFASCDSTLGRSPIAREVAEAWCVLPDPLRRRCAFLLFAELSENKKDKALTDAYFLALIARVRAELQGEENYVKDAMNAFLLYVGQRNAVLNAAALEAAQAVGKVAVDYGDNSCEAPDVAKHLSGPHIRKKVGLAPG